jgi:hypothetical protein
VKLIGLDFISKTTFECQWHSTRELFRIFINNQPESSPEFLDSQTEVVSHLKRYSEFENSERKLRELANFF